MKCRVLFMADERLRLRITMPEYTILYTIYSIHSIYVLFHSVYQIVQVYTSVYMGMGRVIHAYCMQKAPWDTSSTSMFPTRYVIVSKYLSTYICL